MQQIRKKTLFLLKGGGRKEFSITDSLSLEEGIPGLLKASECAAGTLLISHDLQSSLPSLVIGLKYRILLKSDFINAEKRPELHLASTNCFQPYIFKFIGSLFMLQDTAYL